MVLLLCLGAVVWAQDSDAPSPSLGEVARQTRAQHASAREGAAGKGCANHNPPSNDVQPAKDAGDARSRDEKTSEQVCEPAIDPSTPSKEEAAVHPATISAENPTKSQPEDTSVAASGAEPQSLGELARQTRQAARDKAQARLDSSEALTVAQPGFQSFSVQYCLRPQMCGEALVAIPESAEVLSHVNGQYIFKTIVNGSPVMLYAGPADVNAPYRSLTDPDYIRIRDLANANGGSHEKTDGVSTQEMTIEGLAAQMTRFRYQRDPNIWWVGQRTLIDKDGDPFLLACTAAEEHFNDAETLCTALVNSLRFP